MTYKRCSEGASSIIFVESSHEPRTVGRRSKLKNKIRHSGHYRQNNLHTLRKNSCSFFLSDKLNIFLPPPNPTRQTRLKWWSACHDYANLFLVTWLISFISRVHKLQSTTIKLYPKQSQSSPVQLNPSQSIPIHSNLILFAQIHPNPFKTTWICHNRSQSNVICFSQLWFWQTHHSTPQSKQFFFSF